MKQNDFIEAYDRLNICDRADMHKVWIDELYKLAKVCDDVEIRDQKTKPGTCCPCIIFEAGDFRAVCYLHSDCFRPAMWYGNDNNGYTSIDYREMLRVLYGTFAHVNAPEYLDDLPAPAIMEEATETETQNETESETNEETTAAAADDLDNETDPARVPDWTRHAYEIHEMKKTGCTFGEARAKVAATRARIMERKAARLAQEPSQNDEKPARIVFNADDYTTDDTQTARENIAAKVGKAAAVVLLSLTIGNSTPAQIYTDSPADVLAQVAEAGETVTAYTIAEA